MFADRRGFPIRPVKTELAEQMMPAQEVAGRAMGIDVQDPCPGAPAIMTTLGPTTRAHLDAGFDTSERWGDRLGVRMAAGLAGEPTCGPVLVFVDCERAPMRSPRTDRFRDDHRSGVRLDRRRRRHDEPGRCAREEADVDHPALVAGPDGAEVVIIFADRRELRSALDDGEDVRRARRRAVAGARGPPAPTPPRRLRVLTSPWARWSCTARCRWTASSRTRTTSPDRCSTGWAAVTSRWTRAA